MEFKIKHLSNCVEVKLVEGATTIDLGMLSDTERDELAKELINVAFESGEELPVDFDSKKDNLK